MGDPNDDVVSLASGVLLNLMASGYAEDAEPSIRKMIRDYNLKAFTRAADEQWTKMVKQCCSVDPSNVLPIVLEELVIMMRDITDNEIYPAATSPQTRVRLVPSAPGSPPRTSPYTGHFDEDPQLWKEQFIFPNKEKLYQHYLKLIRSQKLQTKFQHGSHEWKFLTALLNYHPDASDFMPTLTDMEVVLENSSSWIRFLKVWYKKPRNGQAEGDQLQSRCISVSRCLDMIRDPIMDPAREQLVGLIMTLYNSNLTGLVLELIARHAPNPHFQYRKERQAIKVKATLARISNYIQCVLQIMSATNLYNCGKRLSKRQSPDSTVLNLTKDGMDQYQLCRQLQRWLLGYLHEMELEQTDLNDEDNIDVEEYNIWLREQAGEFSRLLIQKQKKLSTQQIKEARKLLTDESILKQKYLELRTEEEIGPVKHKLDTAFTTVLNYFKQEHTRLRSVQISLHQFATYFDYPVQWYNDQTGLPVDTTLRNTVVGHEDVSAFKGKSRIDLSEIWYFFLLQDFKAMCLEHVQESCLIPLLIFYMIHCEDFSGPASSFLDLLKCSYCKSDSPKERERCARYLISFATRSALISISAIEDILAFLATHLLQQIRAAVTENNVLLCATLFSGCLEILIARWSDVKEEAETRRLIRLLSLLAFSDEVTQDGMISRLRCVVAHAAAERLKAFDLSYAAPLTAFLKKLMVKGQGLMARGAASDRSLFALEGEWPVRPFDRSYLREFGGQVAKNGWLDCWARVVADLPAGEQDAPLEIGKDVWKAEWDAISGGAPVSFLYDDEDDDSAVTDDDTGVEEHDMVPAPSPVAPVAQPIVMPVVSSLPEYDNVCTTVAAYHQLTRLTDKMLQSIMDSNTAMMNALVKRQRTS